MFSNFVRFILIAISALAAFLMFYSSNYYYGILFIITTLLFSYGYFRYGAVNKAFNLLQKGENKKAEKLIDSVKYPSLLAKQQMGFYFFTKAVLENDKGNTNAAENFYLEALKNGVRTKNNEAVINLQLAKIYLEKDLNQKAREHLQMAQKLSDKNEIISEIEKLIPQIEN